METAEKGRMVQPSLLKALYKAYGLPYLLLGIIKLVNDILSFAGPVLLNVLIRYLETPSEPFESGPGKAADGQHQWAGKAANGQYQRAGEATNGHHQGPWLPATDSLAFGLCCAGLLGVTSLVKVSQSCLCKLAVNLWLALKVVCMLCYAPDIAHLCTKPTFAVALHYSQSFTTCSPCMV